MKKYLYSTLLFLFVFSINGFAQINFEKGNFINNQGEQINCLIKNLDWKNNPTEFEYKLTENSETKTLTIKSVSEFVITSVSKYVRANVEMDRSSSDLDNISLKKGADFKEEELFLKVLVEGDKSLYQYTENRLNRYFYNSDAMNIVQLVYKIYEVTTSNESKYFGKNETFKQQLFNNVNCENKSINKYEAVLYKQKSLTKIFLSHNECNGNSVETEREETERDEFNLRIRPGLNLSSLSIQNHGGTVNKDADFGNQTNFRFGIEAEYVLPFNRNKWSIFIEPTYQYFKGEVNGIYYSTVRTEDFTVDYKSIELPIGVRHKFFIGDKLNVFLNTAFVIDIEVGSKVIRSIADDLDVETRNNIVFGIGAEFRDKFSLELRIGSSRELLQYAYWESEYNTTSLIFGYKLF